MTSHIINDESHWEYYQLAQRRAYDALDVRERQESLAKKVRKYGRKNGRVMEIGFARGYLLTLLHNEFACTGVDISSANVDLTRSELRDRGIDDIELVAANVLTYEPGERFDVIVACHVIEHFRDDDLAMLLSRFRSLLRTGGVLIGAVPYMQDLDLSKIRCPSCGHVFDPDGHEQSFTKARLERFLKDAGFARVELDTHVIGDALSLRNIAKRLKYLFTEGGGGLQFVAFSS
jgi:SAM-dependent methyltransferase